MRGQSRNGKAENGKRERPMLFSGAMVRALLAGTKTQTRRVVKPQPQYLYERPNEDRHGKMYPGPEVFGVYNDEDGWVCPYGQPGDRLWVRETWNYHGVRSAINALGFPPGRRPFDELFIRYKADNSERTIQRAPDDDHALPKQRRCRDGESADDYDGYLTRFWSKWTPSIYMPRDVSRITLEVVSVRVERLQDISEADAEAEGVDFIRHHPDADETLTAKTLYSCLWDSINGAGSWAVNPWVWVVEFKRVGPDFAQEITKGTENGEEAGA